MLLKELEEVQEAPDVLSLHTGISSLQKDRGQGNREVIIGGDRLEGYLSYGD